MKRFHIHVGVRNIEDSVRFYSTLFGQEPTKLKEDYAKWMLEDPRLNFAISTRTQDQGVDHLGLQVDSSSELAELTDRLRAAHLAVDDEGETTCCYAESEKSWVKDPSGIAWETYQTKGDAEIFKKVVQDSQEENKTSCCEPLQFRCC
ncbi:MAG: Glyoxalase [Pseudomonadota bacterium]|jgi:catechol 2,3-dioxygenase-like lactoylglutathione lyase family enzyme